MRILSRGILYENTWDVFLSEHLSVRNLILPFDVEEFPEAHSVEVVHLVCMHAGGR